MGSRRLAAWILAAVSAATLAAAAAGWMAAPREEAREILLTPAPSEILGTLSPVNGTCGVVWVTRSTDGVDCALLLSEGAAAPGGIDVVVTEVGSFPVPGGAHVEILGRYGGGGAVMPWGEVPGRLVEVPVPRDVERYEVTADGVRLLYIYEDGLPAVLVAGERPKVVLVAANVSRWISEDPEGLACLLGSVLRETSPQEGRERLLLTIGLSFAGVASAALVGLGSDRREPEPLPEQAAGPLAHPTRAVLLSLIQDAGAASLAELSSELNLPRSTLSYHLSVLEREGFISSEELIGEKMFFLPEVRQEALIKAALRSPTRRRILTFLIEEGPSSIRGLSSRLGLSTETVKRNVDLLEKLGLVSSVRAGRRRIVSVPESTRRAVRERS